jgi:iron complex outermembrane receptor protein
MMLAGAALAFLPWLAMAASAPIEGYAFPIDVQAQPMASALQEFARETGVELLFDQRLVQGMRCARVRERLSVEAALRRLLNGSSLVARRSATGAWLIERAGAPPTLAPDLPLPDILVVGTRTQNTDIRRRENDVQPYQVVTGKDIVRAHRDDLGDYYRNRVPPNAEALLPVALRQFQDAGAATSRLDLRGLGADETLILVDGRRLPDIPSQRLGFIQPDLNSIPLDAIDRVETLTGTAGGIYGFGALGGVVNLILKRDYRGAELDATAGITSRGDARRFRIEGRVGFTPDGGRTDVMISASRSYMQPLLIGDRDDTVRNREIAYGRVPDTLINSFQTAHAANSLGVFSFEDDLSFKPEFGGGSLGSALTSLPAGFSGATSALVDALKSRAGRLDLSLNAGEATSDVAPAATTTSAIFNLRHRFATGVEGYFDALFLRNHGKLVSHDSNGILFLYPDSPKNPFEQVVWLTFPVPGETFTRDARFDSSRYVVGAIVDLPLRWKGTVEAIFGSTRYQSITKDSGSYTFPLFDDEIGGDNGPDIVPFGDWKTFQDAVAAYTTNNASNQTSRNVYRELSLRLAGPILAMGGGEATVSLLAERRTQRVPPYRSTGTSDAFPGDADESFYLGNARATTSLYAELHAPVFGDIAPLPFLRKLEIQLAARYDRMLYDFAVPDALTNDTIPAHTRFQGIAYTAGAKFFPMPWLMLRASYATGAQPPSLGDLIPSYLSESYLDDPKRPVPFYESADVPVGFEGSPTLHAVRAQTLSLGAVFNPSGDRGPRFSLDYSRIRRTGDVIFPDEQEILDHEDLWPGKVQRAPLTDEDRALGYTGGAITFLDARAMNAGELRVDTLDGKLDWTMPFAGGKLRLYGTATVQLRNEQAQLFGTTVNRVAYAAGPLRWRGNGGVQWTSGPMSVGANVQYYSRYRAYTYDETILADDYDAIQGSKWVSPQAFLDLDISRRFTIPGTSRNRRVTVDLGIVNVLDRRPAREAEFSILWSEASYYADQRRRRFELTISADF